MLAAGIKTPVPLEELESHLREEIEEQVRSGINEQQAFEVTVLQIGPGKELKTEFTKEQGWRGMLHDHMSMRARYLLVIWVAYCSFIFLSHEISSHPPGTWLAGGLLIALLAILAITAYLAGIFWSIFLSRSTKLVHNAIKVIGLFSTLIILILSFRGLLQPSPGRELLQSWSGIVIYFNIFTIVLLESLLPSEPKKATK